MTALNISPAIGSDLFTTSFDTGKLAGLTMSELQTVREGAKLAADVLLGFLEQPRCSTYGTNFYNASGEALNLLREAALDMADAIEDEACRRKDAAGADAKLRAWILLRARAEREDDEEGQLLELVKIAGGEA